MMCISWHTCACAQLQLPPTVTYKGRGGEFSPPQSQGESNRTLSGKEIMQAIVTHKTVTYLPYRVSGSTLTAVGRSRLLARWPVTHSRILSGIQRAAQTVLGVYFKRTCSRVTSASSALGVLSDYALYKSTHSLS